MPEAHNSRRAQQAVQDGPSAYLAQIEQLFLQGT